MDFTVKLKDSLIAWEKENGAVVMIYQQQILNDAIIKAKNNKDDKKKLVNMFPIILLYDSMEVEI